MIPIHSVLMGFTFPFTPPCLLQRRHKCPQTLNPWLAMPSVLDMTRFAALFAMTVRVRLVGSHPCHSSLFSAVPSILPPHFLIQNT
jgi:hypothetical protein